MGPHTDTKRSGAGGAQSKAGLKADVNISTTAQRKAGNKKKTDWMNTDRIHSRRLNAHTVGLNNI